ncbi:hypothetical protein SKAU_G00373790 [Synaphobranchus kaupii]|uniref:Uncharacterized protein n=1 Tax=Synaphobranchus kaupii TaxID=118154 RepID=A0A9Q1IE38_SYNKA|nr:hypothetical protein SKAU_G00373790 [Synaphobranchus kaupii]
MGPVTLLRGAFSKPFHSPVAPLPVTRYPAARSDCDSSDSESTPTKTAEKSSLSWEPARGCFPSCGVATERPALAGVKSGSPTREALPLVRAVDLAPSLRPEDERPVVL